MAGSRITVEVAGNSASLQAAVAKAAESLKGLGTELASQTDKAAAFGTKTERGNERVAASYQQMARGVSASLREQMSAVARASAALEDADGKQIISARKVLEAQTKAAAATARASAQITAEANRAAKAEEKAGVASQTAADKQVSAATRSATAVEGSAKRIETAFGNSNSEITRTGKAMTVGLLGAAAASVALAVKFQANTTRIQTQAGATAKEVDKIRVGLLNMASQVGYTPDQLADGMYHVVSSMTAAQRASAGVTGELLVMKDAAKLAQVGHSDLEDTTYALVSALQSLHLPLKDVGKLTGEVNAIVGAGDMTMTDFVESLKSGLLPAARTAGISMQSVGAAMAAMGDQGMRGSLAGTRLRMSIALLSSPSAAAAKVLDTLGLSSKEATSRSEAMSKALQKAGLRTTSLSADLRKPDGISYALADLKKHLEESGLTATGAAAVMNKAFGGGRMGATITLLEDNLGRVNSKFDQIGKGANAFGHDWQVQTKTTAQQLHDMEAGAAALATRLGTDLLPYVEDGIHDLTDFVKWLEKGGTAAHSLEVAVGTFATVAIGSFFASQVKKAITLVKDLRSVAAAPFKLGGSGKLTGAGSSALGAAEGGGLGIGGAKSGYGLPGSMANPIIVAIEAGEYAGLGSEGAAGTVSTEEKAAQAETGAAESAGIAAPAVAGGASTAAEAGLVGSVVGGLKTAVGSLLKGGLIAGLGVAGSQAAGKVIGGGTGRAVADVGTGASVGAGLGSFIGPEGTLAGGITGALVGGFADFLKTDADKYGNDIAAKVTAPLGKKVADQYSGGIANALNRAHSDTEAAHSIAALPASQSGVIRGRRVDSSAASTDAVRQNRLAGQRAAQAFVDGEKAVKFPSTLQVFQTMETELNALPAGARNAAAKTMLTYANTLQSQGKLPQGAVSNLIQLLKAQFPGLDTYLQKEGMSTASDFANAMKMTTALSNTQQLVGQLKTEFGENLFPSVKLTSGNLLTTVTTDFEHLRDGMGSMTAAGRKQAEQEFAQLKQAATQDATAMAANVSGQITSMKSSIVNGSATAVAQASGSFTNFATNVRAAMSEGTIASAKGIKIIGDALNTALKAFGEKPLGAVTIASATPAQLGAVASGTVSSGALANAHATGGFIGNIGEKGRDAVPITVGRGEAVLNHQQQAVVNGALSATGIGSLSNVFNATTGTRHFMASGGFAGGGWVRTGATIDPPQPGNPSESKQLANSGMSFAELLEAGANAGRRPDLTQLLGEPRGSFGMPMGTDIDIRMPGSKHSFVIQKSDVGSGQPSVHYTIDLHSGIASAMGWGGNSDVEVAKAGTDPNAKVTDGGGGAIAGVSVPTINAPSVKGTGTVASIVKGALGLAAKGANSKLQSMAPATSSGGGGGGPVFPIMPGKVPPQVQWALSAAQTIAARNLPYGHMGAGWGLDAYDCSSYVSTVMDAAGIWPKWTYYTAAGPINAHTDPGPGKWITIATRGTSGNDAHTMMEIDGHYFESSHTGLGPHVDSGWSEAFDQYRHPKGFASGGMAEGQPGHQPTDAQAAILSGGSGAAKRALIKKLNPGLPAAMLQGMAGGGIAGDLKVVKNPKAPKPKAPPKVKSPKHLKPARPVKLPKLPTLAGFDQGKNNQIAGLTTRIGDLGNVQSYLESLHQSVPTEALVTLADGTQVVNWDGMIDPTTGSFVKGIDQRLAEIGDPGTNPNATATRSLSTELGVDESLLDAYLQQTNVAGRVAKDFGPWSNTMAGDQEAWSFVYASDVQQANWLDKMLSEAVPFSSITIPDQQSSGLKYKPANGRARAKLQKGPGGSNWFQWIAGYLEAVKNALAQTERITELKEGLPALQAKQEAAINARFAAARHKIQNAGIKSTYSASSLVATQQTGLETERRAALLGVPSSAPKGWKGSKAGWDREAAQERADIEDEFDRRRAGIGSAAAQKRFQGEISRSNALYGLGVAESNEKTALTLKKDGDAQVLADQGRSAQQTKTNDTAYLRSQLRNLKTKGTGDKARLGQDNTTIADAKTFMASLSDYLDPMGTMAVQNIATMENITIPGALMEISQLNGTPALLATSASSTPADDSAAIQLLQQINLQLSQQVALSAADESVLRGMIPLIPSYDVGGPILRDTLAQVHQGEHVVPKGGTLVMREGSSEPSEVHIHQHFHGNAQTFNELVDQRIAAPGNVRVVSKGIGARTRLLRG